MKKTRKESRANRRQFLGMAGADAMAIMPGLSFAGKHVVTARVPQESAKKWVPRSLIARSRLDSPDMDTANSALPSASRITLTLKWWPSATSFLSDALRLQRRLDARKPIPRLVNL